MEIGCQRDIMGTVAAKEITKCIANRDNLNLKFYHLMLFCEAAD